MGNDRINPDWQLRCAQLQAGYAERYAEGIQNSIDHLLYGMIYWNTSKGGRYGKSKNSNYIGCRIHQRNR